MAASVAPSQPLPLLPSLRSTEAGGRATHRPRALAYRPHDQAHAQGSAANRAISAESFDEARAAAFLTMSVSRKLSDASFLSPNPRGTQAAFVRTPLPPGGKYRRALVTTTTHGSGGDRPAPPPMPDLKRRKLQYTEDAKPTVALARKVEKLQVTDATTAQHAVRSLLVNKRAATPTGAQHAASYGGGVRAGVRRTSVARSA